MSKNCVMFFQTAILGVIAVFLFIAPQAHAYAIGGAAPTPVGTGVDSGSNNVAGSNYDIGSSFQNLISPFTGFINSLKMNNHTMVDTSGTPGTTWPAVNMTPVLETSVQNILSQWFHQFDNWFYSVTGVQLNGILVALLSLFSWALRLAQQVVNWLLGLFH
jgi:phage-related protein